MAYEIPLLDTNVQTFTSSGTYTPTAGMKYCFVEVLAGGGGGGAAAATVAGQAAGGGGGGGGGYAAAWLTAAQIGASKAITVGAGGAGGISGVSNGVAGGSSSLTTLVVATGGSGGLNDTAGTVNKSVAGSAGGIGTTGMILSQGGPGGNFIWRTIRIKAVGGYSFWSPGGLLGNQGSNGASGEVSSGFGGGGGGGMNVNSTFAVQTGAVGGAGVVYVTEYLS